MKKVRFLSFILTFFLLLANCHAITVKAAPLKSSDSLKIARAVDGTSQLKRSALDTSTRNPFDKTVFINSFTISDLDSPVNGKLLDSTATVTADNGFSWEIPVIWVNWEGSVVKVAVELDEIKRSYPIFVFYLPEGYRLVFGEKPAYNISLPDFVCRMIEQNGVTTLANPEISVTYITPLLPNKDRLVALWDPGEGEPDNRVAEEDTTPSSPVCPFDPPTPDDPPKPDDPPTPDDPPKPDEPERVPQYSDFKIDLSDDEKSEIADKHGDSNVVDKIGEDNLAWFVCFIKDVIEPEAVNLLKEKFPAYKTAADNDELGKDLGFYVYYDQSYDDGKWSDESRYVAYVTWHSEGEDYYYRLGVNAKYMYAFNDDTGEYQFNGDEAYAQLERTIIHEMMHAFMVDYSRTGMSGGQYKEGVGLTYDNKSEVAFPNWFMEGIATAVGSPYQHWRGLFLNYYGYDYETDTYKDLKDAYLDDKTMTLPYSENFKWGGKVDNRKCSYATGYLANVYLGYLAAQKNGEEAISVNSDTGETVISSQAILNGVNYILDELHKGSTLDDIIADISTTSDGKTLYSDTDDFAAKFIASTDSTKSDDNKSLDFCTQFLNYLESASNDEEVANGSILTDFKDTSTVLLYKELLEEKPEEYVLTDSSDRAKSTVLSKDAFEAGGKSEKGIIEDDTMFAPSIRSYAMIASKMAENETTSDVEGSSTDSANISELPETKPVGESKLDASNENTQLSEEQTPSELSGAEIVSQVIEDAKGTYAKDDQVLGDESSNVTLQNDTDQPEITVSRSAEETNENAEEKAVSYGSISEDKEPSAFCEQKNTDQDAGGDYDKGTNGQSVEEGVYYGQDGKMDDDLQENSTITIADVIEEAINEAKEQQENEPESHETTSEADTTEDNTITEIVKGEPDNKEAPVNEAQNETQDDAHDNGSDEGSNDVEEKELSDITERIAKLTDEEKLALLEAVSSNSDPLKSETIGNGLMEGTPGIEKGVEQDGDNKLTESTSDQLLEVSDNSLNKGNDEERQPENGSGEATIGSVNEDKSLTEDIVEVKSGSDIVEDIAEDMQGMPVGIMISEAEPEQDPSDTTKNDSEEQIFDAISNDQNEEEEILPEEQEIE